MDLIEVFKEFERVMEYLQEQVNKVTAEGVEPTAALNPVPARAVAGVLKRKPVNKGLNVKKLALSYNGISIIEDECMIMLSETKIYIPSGPSSDTHTITKENMDKAEDLVVDRLIIRKVDNGADLYNYYLTPETERPFIFKLDDYIVSISSIGGVKIYTNIVMNSILKRILIENEI